MKKNLMPAVKKTAKSAFALSLAATMVVPAGVSVVTGAAEGDATSNSTVAVPEPIKVYDFENGLKEYYDDDANFSITKSKEIYFQKTPEEVEANETVDANGLVYTGAGSQTRYHKGIVSNQPTTAWDDEKGTVLKIGKTETIPAIYKTQPAGIADTDGAAALDAELPYEATGAAVSGDATGVLIQEEYVANSEIVVSNPYGSEELAASLVERSEFDNPVNDGKNWKKFRGSRYQPVWNKGLTLSYWIKVPADENGNYKPSSVLRWELLEQEYYQADDYGKHLACLYWDEEKKVMGYTDEDYAKAAKNESKVIYGSEYYFKYLETTGELDAEGAPIAKTYAGGGFAGPVYDGRYFSETPNYELSWYYAYNPNFHRGYITLADGSYQAQDSNIVSGAENYYSLYSTLDIEKGSYVRRADVDGELQIDVDNSIFWVADDNQGINKNPNVKASYGSKAGMQNGDVFFMNSWLEGQQMNERGDGYTYDSAKSWAVSPVTSIEEGSYNEEDGTYVGVKNGNVNKWHQVTVTLQNDWVEFYVDGYKADVDTTYASRGGKSLDNTESFKRLNKGTGLRYGWGSEKGAINFSYGNYVCRLLMDWITDEEATLHIGGAGQYAKKYAQADGSCEFSLDDLKFYDQLLTEEQIITAYNNEVDTFNAVPTAAEAKVVDMTAVSDASVDVKDAVKTTVATIEGNAVNAVQIAANGRQGTSTAAGIANPFAGKDLEGATISYWVKQDDAERTSALSFIDTEKFVENIKDENNSGDATSILYVTNDGSAVFTEGYSNAGISDSLKNTYITRTDVTNAAVMLTDSAANWKYVTLTMTNAGIKYYVDGKLIENKDENITGSRFLDGYYQRLKDEVNPQKRFGALGSTNNQCATTLMDFITADDTTIYLGNYPMKGGMGYYKTSGATFAGMKTVDAALSDAEVATLYADRFKDLAPAAPIEPEKPAATQGDPTGNGKVELDDAQMVLKIALKINKTPTDAEVAAADVDGNGKVELADAQKVLKVALKIDKTF